MSSSFSLLEHCLTRALPFVAYRLPQSEEIRLLVADTVTAFSFPLNFTLCKLAFYIIPFDNESEKSLCLTPRFDISLSNVPNEIIEWIIAQPQRDLQLKETPKSQTKEDYFQSFREIQKAIMEGQISKAILSRIQLIDKKTPSEAVDCFQNLCRIFLNTYNYLLYLPEIGLWCGATPELLLKKNNERVETVSLAGTTLTNQQVWHEKEFEEQGIVTDYIESVFSEFGVIDFQKTVPFTASAGRVSHLKTEFSFSVKQPSFPFEKLLGILHPTPAVCGIPKEDARKLILNAERYHRSLYSGFIGKVEETGDFTFFVNIRSMQFFENSIGVYVGGGITAASEAELEYSETENKADSLIIALEK